MEVAAGGCELPSETNDAGEDRAFCVAAVCFAGEALLPPLLLPFAGTTGKPRADGEIAPATEEAGEPTALETPLFMLCGPDAWLSRVAGPARKETVGGGYGGVR